MRILLALLCALWGAAPVHAAVLSTPRAVLATAVTTVTASTNQVQAASKWSYLWICAQGTAGDGTWRVEFSPDGTAWVPATATLTGVTCTGFAPPMGTLMRVSTVACTTCSLTFTSLAGPEM